MARVKRGVIKTKHRKNVLARTKGFRFGRKSKKAVAREAIVHAGAHAFRDRKQKKRLFRGLWNIRMNAALRTNGTTYSKFIGALKKKNIPLNRKVLSEIAAQYPAAFTRIVEKVK